MAKSSRPALAMGLLLGALAAGSGCSRNEMGPPPTSKAEKPAPKGGEKKSAGKQKAGEETFPQASVGAPGGIPEGVPGRPLKTMSAKPPAEALPPPPPLPDRPLTWNAWVENDAPQLAYQPLQNLKPEQDYIVGVDLAAFAYRISRGSMESRDVRSSLRRWLSQQTGDVVRLKALVVADPVFFTATDQSFVDLTIDRRLIDPYFAQSSIPQPPPDAMADLRQNSRPPYRFGYLETPLKVHAGAREGRSYLAVSFWTGINPLDSIVLPVCLSASDAADACGPPNEPVFSASNAGRLNVGAPDPGAETPAASLHFIEVSTATLAVLRTADPASSPVTWQLKTLPTLAGTVATLLGNFASATTDESARGAGSDLFDALLPPESAGAGRVAFEKLLADRRQNPSAPPPLIWVRVDPRDPAGAFSIPLALAAVDGQMLGDWFRVQPTLQRQDYQTLDACISNWVKLLPPPTAADFQPAQPFLTGWFPGFTDTFNHDPNQFRSWINAYGVPEDQPTVLFTLSHYFKGGISFDQVNWVAPSAVHKPFNKPSVALIEGCDGAAPGADAFLQNLNLAGFQTIITTAGTVKAYLAGQYFQLLNKVLGEHPDYTLSRAHFEAVKALEEQSPGALLKPYGARALIFSLLGDGSLKVCPLRP